MNTERKLEAAQGNADASGGQTDERRSAEGRMVRLETGAEAPTAEQVDETIPDENREIITPNEEEELPPDWRFIVKESYWIPAGTLLLIVYFAAEFSDSSITAPGWLLGVVWVIALISIAWLILAGIAYLLSPPRW